MNLRGEWKTEIEQAELKASQLWQDHGGRQQKVDLQFQNDGTYLIKFVHSGKALYAESNSDGSNVSQSSVDGSDLQRWVIKRSGAGYTLKNKAGNQWLNVRRADTKNGTNIQTWSNGGVAETIFNLVPTDFDALPNGRYAIKTKLDTTKTIDIRLASHHDFANAQIWTDYNSARDGQEHTGSGPAQEQPGGGPRQALLASHTGLDDLLRKGVAAAGDIPGRLLGQGYAGGLTRAYIAAHRDSL